EYNVATNHDDALGAIQRAQGFDGHPRVVSREDFDAAVENGEIVETHRGIGPSPFRRDASPEEMAEEYRSGPLHSGIGINGNGTYVAKNAEDAAIYGSTTLRIGLRRDARVISADDLDVQMDAYFAGHPRKSAEHQRLEADLLHSLAGTSSPRARANLRRDYRAKTYAPDRQSRELSVNRDPGRFAALRGYDAIEIPKARSPDNHTEWVILNRTSVIVQEA